MALLEDTLGGWGGGLVVGVGAAFVGPALLAVAGVSVRPIARTLVRSTLAVVEAVSQVAAEASERVYDLVAEVRAESAEKGHAGGKPRPTAVHH